MTRENRHLTMAIVIAVIGLVTVLYITNAEGADLTAELTLAQQEIARLEKVQSDLVAENAIRKDTFISAIEIARQNYIKGAELINLKAALVKDQHAEVTAKIKDLKRQIKAQATKKKD